MFIAKWVSNNNSNAVARIYMFIANWVSNNNSNAVWLKVLTERRNNSNDNDIFVYFSK